MKMTESKEREEDREKEGKHRRYKMRSLSFLKPWFTCIFWAALHFPCIGFNKLTYHWETRCKKTEQANRRKQKTTRSTRGPRLQNWNSTGRIRQEGWREKCSQARQAALATFCREDDPSISGQKVKAPTSNHPANWGRSKAWNTTPSAEKNRCR